MRFVSVNNIRRWLASVGPEAAIAGMEESQQVDIALQTKTLGVDTTFEVVVVPTLEVDDGGMVAHEVSAQPIVRVDIALADAERDFSPLQYALE